MIIRGQLWRGLRHFGWGLRHFARDTTQVYFYGGNTVLYKKNGVRQGVSLARAKLKAWLFSVSGGFSYNTNVALFWSERK